MKKLIALMLAALMVLGCVSALADAGSEPDWKEYDALIAEIKMTTDFEKRAELMHQAEDILMDTGAIVPIYYYNDVYMAKDGLTGFYSNPYGTKFFMYSDFGDKTTLRLQLASEPDKLDPALNSSVDGACLAANSFGGLYTYDSEGNYAPNYATGYTVSEDGLTYVFTIREGLKWSDGTPLTAKDFEYSWKRAAAEETAADYSYMFDGIAGYPDNLQVAASEDGTTLTVVLKAPCAYMLDLAAFPTFYPVQQACVEAGATADNPGAWALEAGFVSSGAYVLESWEHDVSMVYVKNPYYWDAENVKIERLEFMLSDDDTAVFAAYENGDLDFTDSVPTDRIASLLDNPEFHIVDELGTYYVIFNVKSDLFAGKTVEQAANMRKALGLLIDRQYIIDTVGQTGQKIATSFLPAGMSDGAGKIFKDAANWAYPNGEDGYFAEEPDVEKAIELLKSAGYEFDANGMLSAATPISFEYLTNTSSGHIAIAECMKEDFAVIGINMTVRNIDWGVFLNERKEGNYDIARNGWVADFNDPINMLEMWTTVSGNNDAQFGR
ncbi:MAG: peptide ABC transporter substrate-binding protein [Clostridiales bacterium]|nr:peptide ABC transporter substrate-binding protein [Clostridiales bacterium]